MKQTALNSIVSLYAIVAVYKEAKGYTLLTNILEIYLNSGFSRQTTDVYLDLFKNKIRHYILEKEKREGDFQRFIDTEIESHCQVISRSIIPSQRMQALVYLIRYLPYLSGKGIMNDKDAAISLLSKIATGFLLSPGDFSDAVAFSLGQYHLISPRNPVTLVTDNNGVNINGVKVLHTSNLNGYIIFMHISLLETILFHIGGDAHLESNNRKLFKRHTYILQKGAVLTSGNGESFYYNDIYKSLVKPNWDQKLLLESLGVAYKFRNGVYGVHDTYMNCRSGEMVAIMGGSGSGKTTLMNLLIGARKPTRGSITINNLEVFTNPATVKGYIGYVPQDDALNEDLTAFDNLYYTTCLASASLNREERVAKVDNLLHELGLANIRNLRVGNPLDKIISGGQRKRLNIAISIISNPGILFLDEPTSGLSSADSRNLMQLLKELTIKGRLIVVNIHQPSSDVFKLFDKLLFIDQGGYPVYFGPPSRVISYLKSELKLVDADNNECQTCGNINPEEIFELVAAQQVENSSQVIPRRLFKPLRWHAKYLKSITGKPANNDPTPALKPRKPDIPHPVRQLIVYSARNFFTKIADVPYLVLSLSLSPLLALLLSVFTRYISNPPGEYSYHYNDNIPAFIFMSIIVAMFVGIMEGSSEIVRERKALKRESFLDLSFKAFVFSKLGWLTLLSALQMGAYVIIAYRVLEIPSGAVVFFLVMWSTATWANLTGLLLSALFKTMASIYVSIPFFLIPQILFSGAVIDFNKVHPIFSSDRYVPAVSEVMASRWAYEAINVGLFTNSMYAREFKTIDKEIFKVGYHRNFLLPEVEKRFFGQNWTTNHYLTPDSANYLLVKNGLQQLGSLSGQDFSTFYTDTIRGNDISNLARQLRRTLGARADSLQWVRDSKIDSLGQERYQQLRLTRNNKLNQVLTDETSFDKLIVSDNEFVRRLGPVYHASTNQFGRSHLYSATKNLAGREINTTDFNLLIIWLMSIGCLVTVFYLKPKF